jgi:hypothetical protein
VSLLQCCTLATVADATLCRKLFCNACSLCCYEVIAAAAAAAAAAVACLIAEWLRLVLLLVCWLGGQCHNRARTAAAAAYAAAAYSGCCFGQGNSMCC